ncbi:MAG: formate dehydrogenase accessory sulfurtransferase FdhD [Armatimonadota bacterium]
MENSEHTRGVRAVRLSTQGTAVDENCNVVVEDPLTITVEGVGSYTLMCTPTDPVALAVGFAFTEGIIESVNDIHLLHRCEDDPSAISMRISGERLTTPAQSRNLIMSSSCGMCGLERIEEILNGVPVCGKSLHVTLSTLLDAHNEAKSMQKLFAQTGGTHSAAIFNADRQIISFAEDVGRHNALDKAIGKCLLAENSTQGCALAFSGRVSVEVVVKAAKAGIELIAAVSAPSSLAVQVAERAGMTLCGFVRGDRATIYTNDWRIDR